MFGYTIKKFFINWIVILAVLVIGTSAGLGFNSLTGGIDLFAGFETLGGLFGGLPSLLVLLGATVTIIAICALLYHMTQTDYTGKASLRWFHVGIVLLVIIFVLTVGRDWLSISDNLPATALTIIGAIVFVTVATLLVTPRTKKVIVETQPVAVPVAPRP